MELGDAAPVVRHGPPPRITKSSFPFSPHPVVQLKCRLDCRSKMGKVPWENEVE